MRFSLCCLLGVVLLSGCVAGGSGVLEVPPVAVGDGVRSASSGMNDEGGLGGRCP